MATPGDENIQQSEDEDLSQELTEKLLHFQVYQISFITVRCIFLAAVIVVQLVTFRLYVTEITCTIRMVPLYDDVS